MRKIRFKISISLLIRVPGVSRCTHYLVTIFSTQRKVLQLKIYPTVFYDWLVYCQKSKSNSKIKISFVNTRFPVYTVKSMFIIEGRGYWLDILPPCTPTEGGDIRIILYHVSVLILAHHGCNYRLMGVELIRLDRFYFLVVNYFTASYKRWIWYIIQTEIFLKHPLFICL